MKFQTKVSVMVLMLVLCASLTVDAASLKALIVTGQSNPYHKWEASSPILRQMLDDTGLFDMDTEISPGKGEDMSSFSPRFLDYDVVVVDYDGDHWPEATKGAFVDYVASGGGAVFFHAANNAFPKWKEYNEITGLGGWGGRNETDGPMIRWRDGQMVRDDTPGPGGSHGPAIPYQIINRAKDHPVLRGLPDKWMHAKDELYSKLRGPAQNLTVLATAYADPANKGTGEHEPILFTVKFGMGRVFHTVMGHANQPPYTSIECVGFITTFQRGAEWAATGKVTQAVPDDFPTANEVRTWKSYRPLSMKDLLGRLTGYQYGHSRETLSEITQFVRSANAARMPKIEKRFIDFLESDATLDSKQFICKKLSVIGTESSVGVLAKMLVNDQTSDMARYALERIPSQEVDQALRDALDKTSGTVRIGIIASVGARGDRQAVSILGKLLYDQDEAIAAASASALGKIGGISAAKMLDRAISKTAAKLVIVVQDAYLNCADGFVAQGRRQGALRIYNKLYEKGSSRSIRFAALRGRVMTFPDQASDVVIGILRGNDPQMRSAAISLVHQIPGSEIVKTVSGILDKLDTASQSQLLSVLANRGDPVALPAVLKAIKSKESDVQIAAIRAMGKLGDKSSVKLLAKIAAMKTGPQRQVARQSLYTLSGEGVDPEIVRLVGSGDAKKKIELIRAISQRKIDSAVTVLLKAAKGWDQKVRLESLKALKEVAFGEHMNELVGLLVKANSEKERKEAQKTVVAVAARMQQQENRAQAVLAVLPKAKDNKLRGSLMTTLGKIGDPQALATLREGLADRDRQVRKAAIRALSDWPSGDAVGDLHELAKSSTDRSESVLALRGFIRQIARNNQTSDSVKVGLYTEAMDLVSETSEKRQILSELKKIKHLTALMMAEKYIEDESVRHEAEAAVFEIAETIHDSHPDETTAILKKLVMTTDNKDLKVKAGKIVSELDKFAGFLTTWQFAGPYAGDDLGPQELFDTPFAPENDETEVNWSILPAGTDKNKPWLLDFAAAIGGDNQAVYIRNKVYSPIEQKVRMELGSDDGIKLWLNGELVHSNNAVRPVNPGDDIFDAELKQGWNDLTGKITNGSGYWGFCMRIIGMDGDQIEGLKVRVED